MKKILIIEDDKRIAGNLARGLNTAGYEAEIMYDGITGSDAALNQNFDLILLDICLPGVNGYEVCKQVRTKKPEMPIIMLTALGEIEDKVEGLAIGADDYIVKPFDFRELTARIAACLRRANREQDAPAQEILSIADLTLNRTTKQVKRGNANIILTAREFALLEYFLLNRGRVLSKADIGEHVWNFNFDPGTNVIEVYVSYLRNKIDKGFVPKLIHTRTGLGYIFDINE